MSHAVARLPAHYREILLLRDLEGLTLAEIASRLGMHVEAAKARLHRARLLARAYLSADADDGSDSRGDGATTQAAPR